MAKSNTYQQIYVQIIFAVQGRSHFVKRAFKDELEKYMGGIIKNHKHKLYAINCQPDHVHIFISMHPNQSVSDLTGIIKSNSSSFLKEKKLVSATFSWQSGFGAFSYSHSHIDNVVKYVLNQDGHHKKITFKQEYIQFLRSFEIEFKEEYLFEFYEK